MIANEAASQGELLPLSKRDIHAFGPSGAELRFQSSLQMTNNVLGPSAGDRLGDRRPDGPGRGVLLGGRDLGVAGRQHGGRGGRVHLARPGGGHYIAVGVGHLDRQVDLQGADRSQQLGQPGRVDERHVLDAEIGEWWKKFQHADEATRAGMLLKEAPGVGKKRRRRPRRRKSPAVPGQGTA